MGGCVLASSSCKEHVLLQANKPTPLGWWGLGGALGMGLSPTFAIGDAVQHDELCAQPRVCKNGVKSISCHHNCKVGDLVVPPLLRRGLRALVARLGTWSAAFGNALSPE